MERTIEAKLVQQYNFTDDQLNDFYTSFPDKKADYEKRNENTVNSLYSFIDFDKFKSDMLEMKKSMDSKDDKATDFDEFTKMSKQNVGIDEHIKIYQELLSEDSTGAPWFSKLSQKEPKNGFKCNIVQRK